MNQSEFIAKCAATSGESRKATEAVLKSAAEVITEALQAGDEVTLPGLGKFSVKSRAARSGRNPKTGEALTIPARRVADFSACKALKDAVDQ